ncbi:MAG: DUF1404 domain-containing protein [Candidatus Aramenus sp.]|nr:DUF1404 domain-containing protein [Candidatus Aramenus sp.]
MELKGAQRYLIFGIALVVASVNPLSEQLYGQLELAKFSFDMTTVWGSALIGIWLYNVLYSKGGGLANAILSLDYSTKGLLFTWVIAGAITTYWYLPEPFAYSVESVLGRALCTVSFLAAGVFAGLGWEAMGNAWKSATLFSMFSMMAGLAEIFLEMASYYSVNFYPVFPTEQLIETSYALFAMAAFPSTYYMVKILRDLDLF